jgi:Ni/Co efflux regulator RcnB
MKKLLSGLMAAVISASFAIASVIPAGAAPRMAPSVPAASNDVVKVQDYRWRRHGDRMNSDHMRYSLGERRFNREWRRGGRDWRRGDWRRSDWRRGDWRRSDFRRGEYRHWRGHRGYRHWRRGYREHDGWWFPLAAFTAGAVIGNVISEPRVIYRDSGGGGHTQWCYNRYRSYRAYDNTFQPYNGPRQQCYSPYS